MKQIVFTGVLLFLFIEIFGHQSGLPDHYPTFLKTGKYGQSFKHPPRSLDGGVSGVKTSGRKTFSKTSYSKTHSSSSSNYNSNFGTSIESMKYVGGCSSQPRIPLNSLLRCSGTDGCNASCVADYRFPDGQTKISLKCETGTWKVLRPSWMGISVGEQQNMIPASCEPICDPPCENNGICYEPNRCNCPENFSGMRCEVSRRPCLNYPPLPMNARRTCSSTVCTVTCLKGYTFPGGSVISNLKCQDGEWIPSRTEWNFLPDCEATCTPPCQNGGNCLSLNVCQCPQDFRGPQCQYRVEACSAKRLSFNGGYNCSGNAEKFHCSLKCPTGIQFEFAPSTIYTCEYSEGVFKPQPIPKCLYPSNMDIIPLGGSKESFFHQTHSSASENLQGYSSWKLNNQYNTGGSILENIKNDTSYSNTIVGQSGLKENQLVTIQERLPSPATCFTWGGTHYKTFNSRTFSAGSDCSHTLVRDARDNTFNVVVGNSKNHRLLRIYLQDKEYILTQSPSSVPILLGPGKKRLPIPGQIPGLRTSLLGQFIVLSVNSVGLTLRWDGKYLIQVQTTEALWNRTEGLCGRNNGDKTTNILGKDGLPKKSITALLDSWKMNTLGDSCTSTPNELNACSSASKTLQTRAFAFCNELLADKKFAACHSVMDASILLDACQWDFCACKEEDPRACACETLHIYVRECRENGVKESALIKWRDEQTCPLKCAEGQIYKSCGPNNGLQPTCGDESVLSSESNSEESCEEGCYCPTGTIFHEGKCITPESCPCRLRGRDFPPGSSVPKECNTCTCESGRWKCTSLECGARCSAIGDPHYQTFDGRRYDFMGQCQYYLIKGDNFSVEATNVPCAGAISQAMNFPVNIASGLPSCTRAVTIRTTSGHIVRLKQNREVTIDGVDILRLPQIIGNSGDVVRVGSSLFVVVELENGLEIWWDGVTRVYIDAPASFREKTRGLCGTFNSNQKDDFLTPEGDVEELVVPFANKWKVDELCEDVQPKKVQEHPCEINVHNKKKAEKYCSIIQSEMFSKCHWLVDPQQYYDDCLFDMCSCEAKISDCLCGTLAGFAAACAALGEIVPWRLQVPECGINCPNGQVYQMCGNPCARTCNDISSRPHCKKSCVEGCNCPEGQALNNRGECIQIGECPCHHDGINFPAGYQEIRSATLQQELCTCVDALFQCRPATKEEIQQYPKATDRQTVCNMQKNQEFTLCEPQTPITCKNMHDKISLTSPNCRPGCQCKTGFVLREAGGSGLCIRPSECPCHHGGRSYQDGETVSVDCNNCTCHQGSWQCTQSSCPASCTTWGDSHYTTFDGKDYDYQGNCDYVFAKGSLGKHDGFEVTVQNVPCSTLGVTCSKSLTIHVSSESLTLTKDKVIPQHKTLRRMALRQTDLFVFVEIADLGVTVTWDKSTRISVRVDSRWKGRLRGLCGNYNEDQQDDFQTPSGGFSEISPQVFGDSWRLSTACPTASQTVNPCEARPERRTWAVQRCGLLKTEKFAACHTEVPVEKFVQRCVFDTCACDQGGDCECLCTALQAYAMECANKGVHLKWRDKDLCPLQCDERCAQYSPCISTCPLETCDNLLSISQLGHLCADQPCVEGCAPKPCPNGQVYLNGSALDCVPRSTCKPVCMELDGIVYSEGDVIEEDECHKCHCTRMKKVCTGKPCTSTTTTAIPNDMEDKCQSGWTHWLNQDKVKNRAENKKGKKLDIEPIPSMILLHSENSEARCAPNKMIDIQCRTVEGHIDPKATGLDVECSLERGLVCKADRSKGLRCPDFEIRVLCQCEDLIKIPDVAQPESCDVSTPHQPHKTDCHAFYHCVPSDNGFVLVEKTCGPNMWYNPTTMICDWPDNVHQIRPECSELEQKLSGKKQPKKPTPDVDDTHGTNVTLCPTNYRYSECGTECHRLCSFYNHEVRQRGICLTGTACEAGCVSESRPLSCPPGWLWRDNATCVQAQDCTCRAHDGTSVPPGTIRKESDCEICQCIENHYTCDKSSCTIPTTASTSTTISEEVIVKNNATEIESEVGAVPTPAQDCTEAKFNRLLSPDASWYIPDDAFTASSTINEAHQPWHARIGAVLPLSSAGAWSPAVNDQDQYLQMDLGRVEPVYGVILLGNPLYDNYVTSFHLLYSANPKAKKFRYAMTKSGMPQLFRGSVDQRTPVQALLDVPVEARYIRFNPRTWHNDISVRLDLIGCADETETISPLATTIADIDTDVILLSTKKPLEELLCDEPMGVDSGSLTDNHIQVSSEKDTSPNHGLRLTGQSSWQPLTNTPNEWVQFDFGAPRQLTGLKTRGGSNGWVSVYKLQYSHDGSNWNPFVDDFGNEKLFPANFDQDTVYTNKFDRPVKAKYLKMLPKKWTNNIAMRVEPLGCYEPYPTVMAEIEEPKPDEPEQNCQSCPGVELTAFDSNTGRCACDGAHFWDGHKCIARAQCPCRIGTLVYAVGTVFEKEDCSQCLCALGGIAQCEPKKCEPCEAGLKATVTTTCGCMCKPCPTGQVLCPTSNICIDEESWCNGIVECPDDEVNCATTVAPVITTQKPSRLECPPVVCPPSYKIQLKKSSRDENLQKNLSPMFHMYGGRKTKMDRSKMASKYYGAKGRTIANRYQGSKTLPRKPLKDSSTTLKNKQQQICVEFICEPPANAVDICPEPACPPGYTVVYTDEDKSLQQVESMDEPVVCRSYACNPPPVRDDICNVTGRSFNTFDGSEFNYDVCNHILARDLHGDDWDVALVRHCEVVCSRNLVIRHGSQIVKMFSDLSLEYNGYRYTAEQTSKIGAKNLAFTVSRMGNTLLFVSNHYGFWLMWNKEGNVKLGVTEKLLGQVDGLCGFYDQNPQNDKRQPNGRQAKTTVMFGDSWLLNTENVDCEVHSCPLHLQNQAFKMCQAVKELILAPCHHAVADIDGWISRCLETTCSCLERAQVSNSSKKNEEKCRCDILETFVVECTTSRPNVILEDWRMQLECPAACETPLVHHDCFQRRCESTCENLAASDSCPTLPGLCFPGCYCPPGLVRKKDRCVTPRECRDCECNVLPHLEYVTFDGANHTAKQNCTYVMARSPGNPRDFEVFVDNAPCPHNPNQICTSLITLIINEHRIEIQRGEYSGDDFQVSIDNITLKSLPFDNGWAEVTRLPVRHVNILISKLQLELRVYYPTLGASLRVPSLTYGGKLEGICGDCDRNPENDNRTPDGVPAVTEEKFVTSWRQEGEGVCATEHETKCEPNDPSSDPCLVLLDADRFGQCHLLLDPAIFLSTCLHDTCGNRTELACSSLETYALGCRAQGLCLDYHTDLCPAQECPPGANYQLCGPPCARTCDKPEGCSKGLPREGCFCPPGLLLRNNTCIEERECFVCDDLGHHPGDKWSKDACTHCTCDPVTKIVSCETQNCPALETVCDEGFEALKIKKSDTDCCDKYACVPSKTIKKECEEPKPLLCADDQTRTLEKRPDGCHDYVCQCKPASECPQVENTTALAVGMDRIVDDSGCCPREQLVCKKEKCPKPPVCAKFHHPEKQPIVDEKQCCPDYKCLPPEDKCLFTKSFTNSDSGGERQLSTIEQEVIELDENATVSDGPCRHCKCFRSPPPGETLQTSCTVTECPSLTESAAAKEYVLEAIWARGHCCPTARKTACKSKTGVKSPGEKWPLDPIKEPCTLLECIKGSTEEEDVTLTKHVVTCDTKCKPGAKYIKPPVGDGECCGVCKQVACVADGVEHPIGDTWKSADFCTEYHCVNDNDTVLVSRKQTSCPKPTEDLLKEFVYEYRPISGECCGQHVAIACLVEGKTKPLGTTWPDPEDPCVTWTCVHTASGGTELQTQRTVQTCNTVCRPGWQYAPSGDSSICCGECIQVKCVVNGTEYIPGDKWASADGCATFECLKQSDGTLSTVVNQETCPDVSACPPENLWQDVCCLRCNMTARPMKVMCEPVAMPLEDTIGLVVQLRQIHGRCRNIDPIANFTECRGQCQSGTHFNQRLSTHESVCGCCQATEYTAVPVQLICVDGHQFYKQVAVPSVCSCEECSSSPDTSVKRPPKPTKS